MPTYAGRIVTPDETFEGFVQIDGGHISDHGTGEPPEPPENTGWIVPSPVNGHTHLGDAFLRDRKKPTAVSELVGPGGWKHHQLAAASPEEMAGGIVRLTDEMAAVGVGHCIDFREGGLAGVQQLQQITRHLAVDPVILGRPADGGFDEREAASLLVTADGIGLSGLRDHKSATLDAWADACRSADKPFAIHVSEDRRDDVEAALALQPAFVVHMVHGTTSDFEALADADVPVVVCPRSNHYFGMKPPVPDMLEAGVRVALGTDNGMLADGNLLREAALLQHWFRLETETLLRMMACHGRDLLGLPPAWPPKRGQRPDLVVLPDKPFPPDPSGRLPMASGA